MKILGLNPKDFFIGWPVQSDFFRERVSVSALTFPVLKQLLPPGHEMRFLDGFYEPIPMKEYLNRICWADVVGLNIVASYSAISYAVAIQQIKRLNPSAFIIAGGHHANMYPERWLSLGVDLIVRGEAELMFAQLVEEISGKRQFDKVPGVMFMKDGQIVDTPQLPQIKTLDESPIPDWDMIKFKYYLNNFNKKKDSTAPLETSRGCVFRCNFCAVPVFWKGTQRYKSIGRVVEELKQLTARHVRQLVIVDDGFGNDLDHTLELMDEFGKFPDMPYWTSFIRLDTVLNKPEIIERLAAGGMRMAMIGFESINEDALEIYFGKGMRKKATLKEYQEIYKQFKLNKIMVNGLFMSSHPDMDVNMETSYLVARTVCDDPHTVNYMPFPGTPGFNEITEKHKIKDMFFHDMKLPIFESSRRESLLFNLLNLFDVARALRMIATASYYRYNYFLVHRRLLARFIRVDRRKIRDFLLMRRKDLTSDEKQDQLMRWYLEDPKYRKWLDNLTDKVFF